jgi:hypothetical protein
LCPCLAIVLPLRRGACTAKMRRRSPGDPWRGTAVRTQLRTSTPSDTSGSLTTRHRKAPFASCGSIAQSLRGVEGLVGCKSRGGSSPLRRMRAARECGVFLARARCRRGTDVRCISTPPAASTSCAGATTVASAPGASTRTRRPRPPSARGLPACYRDARRRRRGAAPRRSGTRRPHSPARGAAGRARRRRRALRRRLHDGEPATDSSFDRATGPRAPAAASPAAAPPAPRRQALRPPSAAARSASPARAWRPSGPGSSPSASHPW